MKIAKKTLSVFLSILMIFTTCSVALSGLTFSASAASTYTVAQVKELVNAAANNAVKTASGSNAWNFTGDDGVVLAAADAIFDYAVNGVRATGTTANPNASDTITAKVLSNLGYSESSSAGKFITSVLNPYGTPVYGQSRRQSYSGTFRQDNNWSNGTDLTNNGNVSYNGSVSDTVTKTATVTVDLNTYLLTFDKVGDIPESFPTKVTYRIVNTNGRTASQTGQKEITSGACDSHETYEHNYTSYKWNYISATPTRTVNSTNTTAKSDLKAWADYFTADRVATPLETMVTYDAAKLQTLINEANTKIDAMNKSAYSVEVTNKFVATTEALNNYVKNLNFAFKIVNAKPNMQIMLDLIKAGYDTNDYANMSDVYTKATAAYDVIKTYEADVFEYITTNYDGFDGFSLDSSKAFIDQLYLDMELYQLRQLKASIDADIAANEKINTADPLDHDVYSNEELGAIRDKFSAYVSTANTFSAEARNLVFTEGMDYVEDFRAVVDNFIAVRNEEIEYNSYYDVIIPRIYAVIERYTNAQVTTRYTEDTTVRNNIVKSYNDSVNNIGKELTDRIYTVNYNGKDVLLQDAAGDYLNRLKANIIARNEAQIDLIVEFAKTDDFGKVQITLANFVGIKSAVYALDADLYTFCNDRGWVQARYKTLYNNAQSLIQKVNDFEATGGLNNFKQNHYHDNNGLYITRYAGDQVDSNGDQIGYPADIARDGAEDNYDVTINNVEQTIVKLDNFITSEDFCALVGFKNKETGEPYSTLSEAIRTMLLDSLFTDEMVNTIVAALFPMVCDMLTDLLKDLSALGVDMIRKSSDPESVGNIVLDGLVNNLSGNMDLYIDGKRGSVSLVALLESLGVYLFPQSLAKVVQSSHPAIANKLSAAGRDWSKIVGSDGKTKLDWTWGVSDPNSFINVMGEIFGAIGPLLQTLLVGKNYSATLPNKAVCVHINNIKYKLGFIPVSASNLDVEASGTINIGGLTLFRDLIVPIFEAIGITNFTIPGQNASVKDIVAAIFNPILGFIDKIADAPLETVLDMLPNLLYGLSMDKLQGLINGIKLNLNAKLKIENIDGGGFVGWLADLLKGVISDNLKFDIPLDLGSMINLKDMLGFEYTNINSLLAYVFEQLGLDLSLPIINAGEIISCATLNRNAPSRRTSGTRINLTADRADVFYYLLSYIVKAVGDRNFVETVIKFIQDKQAEGGAEVKPIELPDIVYAIIAQVGNNPKNALAALVELFNPQKYDTMSMDWFKSDFDYDVNNLDDTSIVYLKYTNDWTREKAEYVVDNVDELLESVLKMTGSDEASINVMLQKVITGLFNNKNFTGLVKGLASLGVALNNEFVYELLGRELKVDLTTWYDAFGYLFPDVAEKYGVTPLKPGDAGYKGIDGVTAAVTTAEDGTDVVTWTIHGVEFADGDRNAFLDLFTTVCSPFAPIISMFLSGKDLGLFNNAITILGYENYANSIGMIFEMLEIDGVLTQAEYTAMDPTEAFNKLSKQLFDWVDYMLEGNTVKKTINLLPRFVYFIQSNGLSTVVHNLLMPILILIDDVRPIINVDINAIISLIVSDLLNYGTLDFNKILDLIGGVYEGETDPDYKYISVDLSRITLDEILKIADSYFGTDLFGSQLVTHGLNGLCAGTVEYTSVAGTAYKPTVSTADSLTIFVTSLIEALQYEVKDTEGNVLGTNGEIICSFIDSKLEKPVAADVYNAVINIINGLDISFEVPNWGYMFEGDIELGSDKVTLPEHSIVYLKYNNDWNEQSAEALNDSLETLVQLVLDNATDKDLAELISGILNDNVYTDKNLNTVVELIVNALAGLDETLRGLVDAVVSTDIAGWFDMCEQTTDAEGNVKFVCTKDWGVDAAAAADKKDVFVNGLKEVLTPANDLLAWFFFGDEYAFFTGSEKDADDNYIYNDVITITGGQGYNYAIVPILEALGCELKPASAYEANGKHDVALAVSDIIDSLLNKVDSIAGKPVAEVFDLVPNLIYFINADGLKTSVNNLLAPVNSVISALSPVVGDVSIGGLIKDQLGFDITDLTMETILTLLVDKTGLVLNDEMYNLLTTFYIGELTQFTSVNGESAYRMTYTDAESRKDMLTIVLSFAVEIVKLNDVLLKDKLPEGVYDAIMDIIGGMTVTYTDPNWAYMYEGEDALAQLIANGLPERTEENSVVYLKYANDWNEATATTLEANLAQLIDFVFKATGNTDSTLGVIISNAVKDNLYSADVLNAIVKAIADLIGGLDEDMAKLVNLAGTVLGVDIAALTSKTFAEGSITTKDEFIAALKDVLTPVERVLAWLLLGDSYEFLNDSAEATLITVSGGDGYAQAIAPILEALGCENLKSADEFADATEAVAYVVDELLSRVDAICNKSSGDTVNELLDLITNVIYFVSADGIKTSVNNLLAPVTSVLEALKPAGVEVDLGSLIPDIDITNIGWDTIFTLLDNNNIVLTDDAKTLIKTFYIGAVEEKTSTANGKQYFTMTLDDAEARRDMITIVLSVALETLENDANKAKFAELFGEETYNMIIAVLAGSKEGFDYANPDWAYMYDGEDALAKLIANGLPARTGENSIVYVQYTNNWNMATASYLNDNLSLIIESIVEAAKGEGSTIGVLLDAAISGGLYKDEILDKLLTVVVKALAGLDRALVESVGAVLGADIDTWFNWCEITRDEEGNVTDVVCTKDWGIDAKATNAEKKEAFVAAFKEALAPANRVIAWLFFGQDYTFLNDATGEDLITITGGQGYAYGIVPILEALGCKNVKPASAYLADGEYQVSDALGDVLTALCDRLTDMCANFKDGGEGSLDVMLDMLPNIIYFVNAGGVKSSVNNLLQPVYFLLETLSPVVGEVNIDELIGFPLSNIDFEAVFGIVSDKVGLNFTPECRAFLENFYMGKVVEFTSANGEDAFYMTYSDTETRREMLTIILSFVLDNIKYDQNEAILTKWFGANIYQSIVNVLGIKEAKPMQDFSWYYTEYANTDKTFTAIDTSERYTGTYNDKWTKERAQYVANNLPIFIGNILCLLGLEVDGVKLDDLETVINTLVSTNIYTQANIDAILNALKGVLSQLDALEPYGTYVFEVLKTSIGFDIHAWDNMTLTVKDGDRASFEAALGEIVAPAAPILKLLLTGKDISLFLDINGGNAITIPGSEGYAYGLIPLLEALGCKNIKTPEEFKAILDADPNAAFAAVADPLFDRLDAIFANPVDEILNMLPAVIYFINSNGLDTCVKNLINSVDTVIAALEPALGKADLMSLLGVDLSTYNFEWIVNTALKSVEESTGFVLAPIVLKAIPEFTVGKVVTYKSVNGETYYTMQYASELDKADMLTIVLRMVVDFITYDENMAKLEEILKNYIPNEDNYKSVCSMLESLQQSVKDDPGLGNSLYLLYYIFVGLNESAERIDDLYHDVNNSWKFILKMLETSNDPVLNGYAKTIKGVLNKYFKDIFDEDGVAANGFIRFFQRIAEFFKKIGEFFRKMFKRG